MMRKSSTGNSGSKGRTGSKKTSTTCSTCITFTTFGFTLVELLVVISIIGVLLSIAIFGLTGARESARDAKRKSDLESIRSGLELYKADCKAYPTANIFGSSQLAGDDALGLASCPSANVYISQMPQDPIPGDRAYVYSPGASGTTYEICASLEAGTSTVDCGGSSSCGSQTCNYQVTNP
ncbi:type II secretion system protein GspG [Candidatus Woesebacteria bacterium]|nr:type II secretion system protein GspG [Candidatus Woesebacteria bacterium]